MNLHLLFSMLLVLAANLCAAFCAVRFGKSDRRRVLRKAGVLLFAELLLLYSLDYIICHYTLHDASPAPLYAIAFTASGLSAVLLLAVKQKRSLLRFLRSAAGYASLALVLELAVFCGNCYTPNPFAETMDAASEDVTLPKTNAEIVHTEIVVTGASELVFPLERDDVRYVQFSVDSEDLFWQAECSITDENFSVRHQSVAQTWMNPSQDTLTFAVKPYRTLHEMKVNFRDVEKETEVRLKSLTLMNVKPFSFSLLRFLALTGILCLIAAIRIFGWHRITYDSGSFIHRDAVLLLLVAAVVGMIIIAPPGCRDVVKYNMEEGVGTYDPYAQTFDAWQRGQVHLHLETDPLLAELENPYDPDAREASGAAIHWDRAFYNGRYYSYFGIAPVIFLYYPMYLFTGNIPSAHMASLVFCVLGMVFLFQLVLTVLKKYGGKVNFLLLLCGLTSTAAVSGLFLCAHYADRYYTVISSGICFLCLYLWLGLEACMAKRRLSRCLLLAGCGLAISAAVLSRPTFALYAVLLIPPFLQLISRKDMKIPQKAAAVASFFVPLLIGACMTMAYNAARFDSPFDFGAAYQLTVSNAGANRMSLSDLPAAVMQYFLNPVEVGGMFPFIRQRIMIFASISHYVYVVHGFGACMFLCIPMSYLIFWRLTRKCHCNSEKRWTYRLAFLLPVVVAFLDYCIGGYNTRYLCDILPVLAVFSTAVILEANQRLRRIPAVYGTFSRISAAVLLLSPVFLTAFFLSLDQNFTMWHSAPDLYFNLRELLVFWR